MRKNSSTIKQSLIQDDRVIGSYKGKQCLVTGACGTLGRAVMSKLLTLGSTVQGVDADEDRVATARSFGFNIALGTCDSRDRFMQEPYDYVFQCADYKHVTMGEIFKQAYTDNNEMQTVHLVNKNFKRIVMASTDKAAGNSHMGKTKRIAEMWLTLKNNHSAVRLVNLVRSRGSVINRWDSGIYKICKEPVERYWMTQSDAVYALLCTGLIAPGLHTVWDMPLISLKDMREAWLDEYRTVYKRPFSAEWQELDLAPPYHLREKTAFSLNGL